MNDKEIEELQEAFDIALIENNRLRGLLKDTIPKDVLQEKIKEIMYGKIDWIKVFKDAYEGRKTSWRELGHIQEWRNATDEVLFAVWKQLEYYLEKELLNSEEET